MKRFTGKRFVGLAGLAASLAMATAAQGAMITYTISGAGSGSLGGVTFTDAAFDILLVGDTDNLRDFGFGAPAITPLESATVRIGGFADAGLTGSTRLGVARDTNLFFFARYDGFGGGIDLFDFHVTDAQEMAFDYAAPYGPVPGFGLFLGQFRDVGTSQGALTFQAASGVTFSAAAVPEPGVWAMMIVGFGGVGALLRRRRGVAGVEVAFSPNADVAKVR
jgi:hypothetical protein